MWSPPQRAKPLRMKRRLIRNKHQQQHNQSRHPPRRAPGPMNRLLLRPRQPNHEPPINKHVTRHKYEHNRNKEEEKAEAELSLLNLGLVVRVPWEGEEEHDDGEDGDQWRRREGEGGDCVFPPPLVAWSPTITKEPWHFVLVVGLVHKLKGVFDALLYRMVKGEWDSWGIIVVFVGWVEWELMLSFDYCICCGLVYIRSCLWGPLGATFCICTPDINFAFAYYKE